ncbi:sensor histidine kinase [Sphingomonas desiccabilis]|uniref:histidine kinase n=1 Tax=Sphingomonas desiccabilis TaxID=429134 RepID=A0A4Q2J143_9SPHN|nr:stimulus-sensing domain-containing protein [Sphingomonas desiccabilis]MBB3910636.1 two-component system sensor histidine kinase ChvG [Sphingomonas desiccabilis]RXZ35261.1 HAMP domain-containing protein [Sphingomonas desiccabilis]
MAPATAFRRSEGEALTPRRSGRVSLTPRILFVNIFALALVAGGFFYLDSFRARILDERVGQAEREIALTGEAVRAVTPDVRTQLLLRMARAQGARLRVYDAAGVERFDSRTAGVENFRLRDPDKEPWQQDVARALDAMIDTVAGTRRAPLYRERGKADGLEWPEVVGAATSGRAAATVWRAPDRSPVITAAAPLAAGVTLHSTADARDIVQTVRAERLRLSVVLLVVALVSVLLSLFLARTIVQPLRLLARAAVRVRLGRAREVVVPRLPYRRDEIGMLARALSDMSGALRARIDATEAFAADVTHELKNPLASLRSAMDSLDHVKDPALQERLMAIMRDDVHRLDRLISDISDASRLDAQLSRAKFEPIDVAALLDALVGLRAEREPIRGVRVRFDRLSDGPLSVSGEGARLERVFENLLDNAVSFSPDEGLVTVSAIAEDGSIVIRVEDEGPGVPEEARDAIFRRFHSVRPASEAFGTHSGLGLAIARTIVEGHGGMIAVESREDRLSGARFVVRLPQVAA